jgi:hypothetical protein
MPKERLREAVEGGRSVFVGTSDADGVPSCCRGIAVTTKDDFETVTVYVPAATAQETMANLATTRRMAVCCSEPLSHRTIQIKGVTRGVKLAPPGDEMMVRQRWQEFEEVLDAIGLPRRVTHRIAHWPAFAIEMSVEQIFEQTPGPKAGVPLA